MKCSAQCLLIDAYWGAVCCYWNSVATLYIILWYWLALPLYGVSTNAVVAIYFHNGYYWAQSATGLSHYIFVLFYEMSLPLNWIGNVQIFFMCQLWLKADFWMSRTLNCLFVLLEFKFAKEEEYFVFEFCF